MTTLSVKLPPDLEAELLEVARLGYEDKSEIVRVCLRRHLPEIKKSFIGDTKAPAKKFRKTLVSPR